MLERINADQSFEDLAKQLSISSNASEGGLMKWRKKSDMPSLFAEGLEGIDVGYISSPLESGAGFHILKVEEKMLPGGYLREGIESNAISLRASWEQVDIVFTLNYLAAKNKCPKK